MASEEKTGIKKSEIEETLQSIDSTLKRIENLLLEQSKGTSFSIELPDGNTNDLVKEHA